jgi:hypothetical protein
VVDGVAGLREPFASLLEPAAAGGEYDYDLTYDAASPDEPPDVVKAELSELFDGQPSARRIRLRVAEVPVGTVTRQSLDRTSGLVAGIGDGDGLTFPIDTADYRAIAFRCLKCGTRAYRSFYDARRIPQCDGAAMSLVTA